MMKLSAAVVILTLAIAVQTSKATEQMPGFGPIGQVLPLKQFQQFVPINSIQPFFVGGNPGGPAQFPQFTIFRDAFTGALSSNFGPGFPAGFLKGFPNSFPANFPTNFATNFPGSFPANFGPNPVNGGPPTGP